jgi:hypothetical protein
VDSRQDAGFHSVKWDGRTDRGATPASGIYFYRIQYPDGGTFQRKMALIR